MISIETNIASFNQTLARYMAETSMLPDDVLEKKGRDLGIKLYQGFAAHKFGGPGKKRPGLAKAELAARTAEGRGTRVRASVMREYIAQRSVLRKDARDAKEQRAAYAGLLNKRDRNRENRALLKSVKDRIGLWQDYIGKEIALRNIGVGVLAASFLWYRSRSSQAKGKYFVKNKTSRPLGYVEKGNGYLRIVGLTDGLSKVDARYGIVARALLASQEDMMIYINRKIVERYSKAFGGAAA